MGNVKRTIRASAKYVTADLAPPQWIEPELCKLVTRISGRRQLGAALSELESLRENVVDTAASGRCYDGPATSRLRLRDLA
jgi:hypothetical protein